jgi:hypothetical protein
VAQQQLAGARQCWVPGYAKDVTAH